MITDIFISVFVDQVVKCCFNVLKYFLFIIDQIHFVYGKDDMLNPKKLGNKKVSFGLFNYPFARIK